MFDLSGKKAIITGAAQGLGRGMAEGLHEAGAELAIIDISDKVIETCREIGTVDRPAHHVVGNIGAKDDAEAAFRKAVEKLGGKLDILVNNAGIQRRCCSLDFQLEDWDEVLRVNLTAVFILCQLAGKIMCHQRRGKIINMASMTSFFGGYSVPAYTVSKGGVAQLTKALACEWAEMGVNVNAIAPGYMLTEITKPLYRDAKKTEIILNRIPARRIGCPDDLKGAVVFLSSEGSNYINGHILPVDGGYLAFG